MTKNFDDKKQNFSDQNIYKELSFVLEEDVGNCVNHNFEQFQGKPILVTLDGSAELCSLKNQNAIIFSFKSLLASDGFRDAIETDDRRSL